ncbi:MAG: RNA-binding S4 domain-containing protein [Caloramator sp.]|nr:RNA-binding S4 domain-containing protein [Caloramator sp.]
MRLDKFLKVSRIIKRRTVAKEVCDSGKVLVNGKVAKPGTDLKIGDIIEIQYATGSVKAEVLSIQEHATKEAAKEMYRIISGREID